MSTEKPLFHEWGRQTFSFEPVNQFVFERTGVKIPTDLIDNFELNSFNWVRKTGPDPLLPTFLLGKSTPKMWTNGGFDDALAAIKIGRTIKPNQAISPLFVQIAGVYKNQNRVVAAEFDPKDSGRITKLNVSLPVEEASNLNEARGEDISTFVDRLTVKLPTDKKEETAGPISKAMCDKAGTNKALVLQFLSEGSGITTGKPIDYDNWMNNLRPLFRKLGYYTTRDENWSIGVGLDSRGARERDLEPWEIKIPKYLHRA